MGPEIQGQYKNLLYDKYDEVAGYKRENVFGGTNSYNVNNLPSEYERVQTGPVNAAMHPNIGAIMQMPMETQKKALQGIADGTGHAFRVNGVTYYKPR